MSNVGMSPRARIVERRTYLRPLNEDGTLFETSDQMKDRVISHQSWLWENQVKRNLNSTEEAELSELRDLMDRSLVTMSGRVKWMGGTELVKARSSAAFNCSFSLIENPADMVDAFWLLLQGCFAPGTKVKMADGNYKNIEDVTAGDMVLSYNENTCVFEAQRVERLNENPVKPMVRVTLTNGESVVCTEDHLFLTVDGKWVQAKNLSGLEVLRHAKR